MPSRRNLHPKICKKYEKIWLINLIVKLSSQISYIYDLLMIYEGISRENACALIRKVDEQLSLFRLLLLTQPLNSSEQHTRANLEQKV